MQGLELQTALKHSVSASQTIASLLPGLAPDTYTQLESIMRSRLLVKASDWASPQRIKAGARQALLVLNEQALANQED